MIKLVRKSAKRESSTTLVDGKAEAAAITRSAHGVVTLHLAGTDGKRYLVHVIGQADQARLGNAVHPAMHALDEQPGPGSGGAT